MRIAIIGGAGTLGRHITTELAVRGHDVRVLSRRSQQFPVDLTTGQGLTAAIEGCSAVIDASNASSPRRARQVLVDGTRRLLIAEQDCGVAHHVGISIVGCERVPMGYYKVKTDQEQVISDGPVPWTLVRAAQFHELVDAALATVARWRVLPIPAARLQTIASAEVAQVVADLAEREHARGRIQVAGPQVLTVADLARIWLSVTERRAVSIPVPVPGKLGRELRAGSLTADHADVLGTQTFADWVAAHANGTAVSRP